MSYPDSFKERHLKPAWEALGSSGLLSCDLLMHTDISTSTAHRECCGLAFSGHPSLPCSASVGQWRSPRQTWSLGFLGGRYFLAASLLLLQYPWLRLSKPLVPPLLLGLLISYAAVWSPRTTVGAARSLDVFCYARHKHRSLWLLVERTKIGESRGCVICQLHPDRL